MKKLYRKVVNTMSDVRGYAYTYVIKTKERTDDEEERQEFYGDYEVDFANRKAFITMRSEDEEFADQTVLAADGRVFSKEQGENLDTLRLTEEDYNNLFTQNGELSLFNFGNYDIGRMTSEVKGGKIIFSNIYMSDYDFETLEFIPDAYKIKIKADKDTYFIDSITFTSDFGEDDSGKITYKYTKVAVKV